MAGKWGFGAKDLLRRAQRWLDQRAQPRRDLEGRLEPAILVHRGLENEVRVGNVSPSGAMVLYAGAAQVGEAVTLRLLDRGAVAGQVRWVRDGRIGINFAAPLE